MENFLDGNPALSIGFIVLNLILLYFLRNKLLDFIARVIQNINRPLDFLISFLQKSNTSIVNLTYRQQVLNFFIVVFAAVLVVSEFSTLNEVVEGFTSEKAKGINIFGLTIGWSVFAAVAYIAISTILGLIAFELIDLKKILQGIFFNDNYFEEVEKRKMIIRYCFAVFLLLILLAMAVFQGELALYRFGELRDTSDENLTAFLPFIKAFYFILGFLTPIVAAFAFISIDIFLSILAKFLIVILTVTQKLLSAIFYAIEVVILITSSPIDKLLELFGYYQVKNVNDINKDKAKIAQRLAPLQSNNEIYLENQAEIFYHFTNDINIRSKLVIVSNNPAYNLMYPSNSLTFNNHLNVESVKQIFVSKFPALENKELEFKYFNTNGDLRTANTDVKLNDLMRETNTLFIELKTMKPTKKEEDGERK